VILAGDIGGTNARLALFSRDLRTLDAETYPTAGHGSLAEIVARFLSPWKARITSACFGVAGPVSNGVVPAVNLPWAVDARELADAVGLDSVDVVNDLEANACGVLRLSRGDLATLNAGDLRARGNCAVVSAGTGLGEAALWWDGGRYHALASEGGHTDFAPRTETEVELYRYLAAELGHVSYERVCSGAGLVNIYRFLRDRGGESAVQAAGETPTPAAITAEARLDRRSLGGRSLDLFLSVYGARAGNVALAFNATGGVYLGGGIAPRLVPELSEGAFRRAFVGKGRLTPLLERIPVHVILNDRAALLGAAHIAAERGAAATDHGGSSLESRP
jgi:glucokinase